MESDNHMREFLKCAIPMFDRHLTSRDAIVDFEKAPNAGTMIEAAAADISRIDELSRIQARLRELEDEAAFLRFEKEMIENELKARIGCCPGIEGVATWEARVTRNFCLSLFIEKEPSIYDYVLRRFAKLDLNAWRDREPNLYCEIVARFPALDKSAWMKGDNPLYRKMQTTYFMPAVKRNFILFRPSS